MPSSIDRPLDRLLDRLLNLAGDAASDDGHGAKTDRAKIFFLRVVLLFSIVVERTLPNIRSAEPFLETKLQTLGIALCLLLTFVRPLERLATLVAGGLMVYILVSGFPAQPNHYFLPTVLCLIYAITGLATAEQQRLALQATRWFGAILLFYTGVQKMIYGTYFHGEFMAWKIAVDDAFAAPFRAVLPSAEWERVRALGGADFHLGPQSPYRIRFRPFVLMSNAVLVFETLAPAGLLWRRTRPWLVPATLAFLVLVETAAREYFFGVLFIAVLLTFSERNLNRPLALAWTLIGGGLLVARQVGAW